MQCDRADRLPYDTFETRFALRLSVVLTAGFAYSMMSQANHGYWLALNAFLLLRPMYEDSASRMKSRFIGTVAGCLLLQLLLPMFHGTGWHFVLATVMAVGLYMETAGTWQQALYSTCFALTLRKWHKIQPGRELSQVQQEYLVDVIMTWIERELENAR